MSLGHKVNVYGNLGYMLGIKSRMDGEMNGRMDGGMDAGWTLGGRWVDGINNFWNGMVTKAGRDDHGRATVSGQNRKIYCS